MLSEPFNVLTIQRFNLAKPRFRLFFSADATRLRRGYGVVDTEFLITDFAFGIKL